jgi:hypothetical protein
MSATDTARIAGSLPFGPGFSFVMRRDLIALRVDDRVCLAAPDWMTREQATAAGHALIEAAGEPR